MINPEERLKAFQAARGINSIMSIQFGLMPFRHQPEYVVLIKGSCIIHNVFQRFAAPQRFSCFPPYPLWEWLRVLDEMEQRPKILLNPNPAHTRYSSNSSLFTKNLDLPWRYTPFFGGFLNRNKFVHV